MILSFTTSLVRTSILIRISSLFLQTYETELSFWQLRFLSDEFFTEIFMHMSHSANILYFVPSADTMDTPGCVAFDKLAFQS